MPPNPHQRFEIQFCVPPEYQFLAAELYYDHEHFGELNTENGQLELVVVPRPSGDPWTIPLDSLQAVAAQFVSRSNFFGS